MIHFKRYIAGWLILSIFVIAGDIVLKTRYETLDFGNSKKKDEGKREGVIMEYQENRHMVQVLFEKTDTKTYQPPLTEDLKVKKYALKYNYKYGAKESFSASYLTIDDNLMQETDGGHIYGIGYRYGMLGITQYISDYKHFDVYQTDLSYTWKKSIGAWKTDATLIGKYLHLQDYKSNLFSQNAKGSYFTPGIKMHAHYKGYHLGTGAFFGKRVFAVMDGGMKVQHHAMEFNKTYMVGIGKHFDKVDLNFKYIYQNATEIPINNENVKVQNLIIQAGYRF
jgi:hypothetical protein